MHGQVAAPRMAGDPWLRPAEAIEDSQQISHVPLDTAISLHDRWSQAALLVAEDGEGAGELACELSEVVR